jgi:hypothetical protein
VEYSFALFFAFWEDYMETGFIPLADSIVENLDSIEDLRDLSYVLSPVHEKILEMSDEKGIDLSKYEFLGIDLDGYDEECSEYSCSFTPLDSDPDYPVAELEFFLTVKEDYIVKTSVSLQASDASPF